MKISKERALYLQNLYINAGRIIMDKIYSKYKNYVNYSCIEYYLCLYDKGKNIYDPAFAFNDTLCQKIIDSINKENTSAIYIIMSPYHRNDVVKCVLANTNTKICTKSLNSSLCKDILLYTKPFSSSEINYLRLADDLFDISNKIQQNL